MHLDNALIVVERKLEQALASEVELLAAAGREILRAGGKRLRPRVVLLSNKTLGGAAIADSIAISVAIELLHTASLVHDDINDKSNLRRGQPSVNARFGDSLALLVGDFVFVKLLSVIADLDSLYIRVLADCCETLVEGETLEALYAGDRSMSEECYLDIVARKTASLFAACAELGAASAGADQDQRMAFREYGHHLGMAFQIRDDTLDFVGQSVALGKPVASDLRQGKMSLAPLYALRTTDGASEVIASNNGLEIAELLRNSGALDYALARAYEHSERAKEALGAAPDSPQRAELCRLADFAVVRSR